jgi:phosphatidylinositol alpha-1,6-mannosyltransferase
VLAHRALLPAAALLARSRTVHGITVICHGSDVWGAGSGPRWHAETRLMRRADVRVVAVSSFTAGALAMHWFADLAAAGAAAAGQPARPGIRLVTAFRLADWEDKGLPQIIEAVARLGRDDVQLTVCGSGEQPAGLRRLVSGHRWCTVLAGLSDQELAGQLAASDLFVLATRTRPGRHPSGEGFGMVLLEAQVAGTPVLAPAHGGSHDAYLPGVTGTAPADESAGALAESLRGLLRDPAGLPRMGARAAAWSAECFAPEQYAELAVTRLL